MRLSGRPASSHASRWSPPQQVILLSLIGLNLAAFAAQLAVQSSRPEMIEAYLGLSYRGVDQAYAWQFFSAIFLHAGVISFVASTFLLYLVGRDLETVLGQKHFLYLYFAGIAGGELGHLFLMPASTALAAASGGVAAVVAAMATILPELEVASPLLVLPFKFKAKYFGYGLFGLGAILVALERHGVVAHSAWIGGCAVGWLYVHLLGYGRPSFIQRSLSRRRRVLERRRQMSLEEFISEEIDPLLEKISRSGLRSLSRSERRTLAGVQEKMAERPQ
jgi:membrane associated rhomboid family serine protease